MSKPVRLLEILSDLKQKELDYFLAFAHLPYHSISANALNWLNAIVANIRDGSEFDMKEEEVLQYGNSGNLSTSTTRILKLLYQYLISRDIDPDAVASLVMMQKKSLHQNWSGNYNALDKKVIDKSQKAGNRDQWYHLRHFEQQEIRLGCKDLEQKAGPVFEESIRHLDDFYWENKLRLLCEWHNRTYLRNPDGEGKLDRIPHDLPLKQLLTHESSGVRAYALIYCLITKCELHGNPYGELLALVKEKQRHWSKPYRLTIQAYLINFGLRRTNSGDPDEGEKLVEWAKWIVSNPDEISRELVSSGFIRTIMHILLHIGELDAAERVLQTLSPFIHNSREQEETINIGRGQIQFFRGDWEESLTLETVPLPKNVKVRLLYHRLLIKGNYELRREDEVTRHLNNLKTYLGRGAKPGKPGAISKLEKEQMKAFVKSIRLLMDWEYLAPTKRNELSSLITHYVPWSERKWLQQKLADKASK